MFEGLERQEKAIVAVAAVVGLVGAFAAGAYTSGSSPTGMASASTEEVRQTMQSMLDRQLQTQRRQLQAAVNRSENLTADDVSMDATIETVEQSQFSGLYRVTISMTGQVPNRFGTGTRSVDRQMEVYISNDGRYLFQPPTDLQQPQPTQRRPGSGAPAPQTTPQ